LLITSQLTN